MNVFSTLRPVCLSIAMGITFAGNALADEMPFFSGELDMTLPSNNTELMQFLEENAGRVVDMMLVLPQHQGGSTLAAFEKCVTGNIENAKQAEYPLSATKGTDIDDANCGKKFLRIIPKGAASIHQSVYPTFIDDIIAGSFRVIPLDEWSDGATERNIIVIEDVGHR